MRSRSSHPLALLALAAACCGMGGCLKHTIQVTTEPEGALVWINDIEVGRTPLETDFTYYGTFDVRIRREGYEPIITKAKADAPIQELPGIDLAAEVIPVQMHSVVQWHWKLTPLAEATQPKEQFEQDLIARAHDLRTKVPRPPEGTTPPPTPEADHPAPTTPPAQPPPAEPTPTTK